MKRRILLMIAAVVAVAGLAVAQNLPAFKTTTRLSYTVATATNAVPVQVSSNVANMVRGWLLVQNTNATSVAIYTATNGTPAAIVAQNQQWQMAFPILDNAKYYVRAVDGTVQTVIVSEGWGQ